MSYPYRIAKELEFDASLAQVWDAIATGHGTDSWFVGTVTAWEPPKRISYRSAESPDGSAIAFDYLIEARDGGSTMLRIVQSGVLDDNWEAEYDALDKGWNIYLHTIGEYLEHFDGKIPQTINAIGAHTDDEDKAWEVLMTGLGITGSPALGDMIHLPVADEDGVVDYVDEKTVIGVRTSDGLYRFSGWFGGMTVGHHIFADDFDQVQAQRAWQAWLLDLYT
jgi:uncharacterized protein YndB with AHSA1/START domain